MNNYSWLEQKLHKFALSSQFMREVTFDFESTNISSASENENHIFITGLARAGTTILLNALYKSNIFASLSYSDMPFVVAPNLWSKISFKKKDLKLKERAHGDGIKVSTESPEAFEEVFWKTFADEDGEELEEKFRIYITNIMYKYNKQRYLSKNNQNIRRIESISSFFSSSNILIPFREPIQHAYSLLTQHKKFIKYSLQMLLSLFLIIFMFVVSDNLFSGFIAFISYWSGLIESILIAFSYVYIRKLIFK